MTDAHCHVRREATRHFLCEPTAAEPGPEDAVFYGYHPWTALDPTLTAEKVETRLAELEARLVAHPEAGVGEIGLDRLKVREIPPLMRTLFERQLALAAKLHRPVVLHGAKCWGQVVAGLASVLRSSGAQAIPAALFHGFSRSGGLIPDIVRLNGYLSVGPALLNDHAVNYRELVTTIPLDRVLVESDATDENIANLPKIEEIVEKLASLRGLSPSDCAAALEANASRFLFF